MAAIRNAYLEAAESAVALLGHPAVAESWDQPSALPELQVSALAAHLANQVLSAQAVLAVPVPDGAPLSLLDHYARSSWVGAGVDEEANVAIRRTAERIAAAGAPDLVAQVQATANMLATLLPAEPPDRLVHLPWGQWSLRLDDFLVTRMMEIAVHSDDLAVSLDVATPDLPPDVLDPVLALLTALAVRRHGQPALLRALSRAERAPATIAAF